MTIKILIRVAVNHHLACTAFVNLLSIAILVKETKHRLLLKILHEPVHVLRGLSLRATQCRHEAIGPAVASAAAMVVDSQDVHMARQGLVMAARGLRKVVRRLLQVHEGLRLEAIEALGVVALSLDSKDK